MDAEGVACPVCSVANPAGSRFCTACGAELPEPEDVTTGVFKQVGVDVPGPGEIGQLIVTRGAMASARFALSDELTTIGRHPDSAIMLDDVTVSRRHAEVSRSEGVYSLTDVGSLNGTYLDGERIESATLREGSQVQIGKFHMVFVIGVLGGSA